MEPAVIEKVQQLTHRLKELPIVSSILERLGRELPQSLTYHNVHHTENVIDEVILFATVDGFSEREIELLVVAAAYHDAGFLVKREENEATGASLAEEAMSASSNYSTEEITLVKQMILDTQIIFDNGSIRQQASSDLSKYLLDADVSNLGRDDFWEMNQCLYQEVGGDREAFTAFTESLLRQHRWLTPAAAKLRESQRRLNLKDFVERRSS